MNLLWDWQGLDDASVSGLSQAVGAGAGANEAGDASSGEDYDESDLFSLAFAIDQP
jgi:hypothetical protein